MTGCQYEGNFAKMYFAQRAKGKVEGLTRGRIEGRQEGFFEGFIEGRLKGRIEGRTEGRAEEAARLLLTVLRERNIKIPSSVWKVFHAQQDLEQLESWLKKATVAASANEVIADPDTATAKSCAEARIEELVEWPQDPEEFVKDFVKWFLRGRTEAAARSLLTVLEARGIPVPDSIREQILAQSDLEQLRHWLEKAAVAGSIPEIFGKANEAPPQGCV
jgi:hypothetical protein